MTSTSVQYSELKEDGFYRDIQDWYSDSARVPSWDYLF